MSRSTYLPFVCLLAIMIGCTAPSDRGELEGVWEMVSGTYTDADTTVVLEIPQIKVLTKAHFAFGRMNPDGAFAGGGTYTFDGTTYTEIVDYHSDPAANDTTLIFSAHVEGDSVWHHEGTIGPNFHLQETWRRVE